MSINVRFKHISPWLLDQFRRQPELVEPFVIALPHALEPGIPDEVVQGLNSMPGIPDSVKRKVQQMMGAGWDMKEKMRDKVKAISPDKAPKILDEARTRGFTLGQMFEVVQFHLSGEVTNHGTSLLSQAVTGGKDIGNDMGYGPATFLTKEDVEKIAKMLSEIPDKEFLSKYSSADWDQETTRGALIYFRGLVSYYDEAARSGHAMLLWGG